MELPTLSPRLPRSAEALMRAIAEAQEIYERRYGELVGPYEPWRNEDDVATSWVTTCMGEK